MPPHKCSYFRCASTSELKSMFRFPWNQPSRLTEWLTNCGNMTIAHLPPENLRSRYVCIDHFDVKHVRCNETRKTLRRTAVPEPYQTVTTPNRLQTPSPGSAELKVLTPQKVYRNKRQFCGVLQDPIDETKEAVIWSTPKRKRQHGNEEDKDTPKCKRLKTLLVDSHKKLKRQVVKNKSLKSKFCNKNLVDLTKHPFRSRSSKLLTKMQLRKSKKQWTDDEKKFCMSLYYKSPAAYKFMIKSGIILAAPSTIQRWLQDTNCLPGINDEVFDTIKNMFSDKSIKERACAVCFDEMSIMTDLEYTNKYDLIEGYEDFGGGDRSNNEAKYALVFIARGIYVNWKMPVAYFLSSKPVHSDKLGEIVKSVINKLFDSGLLPKVTVCDQATTNVKVIKNLGATADNPFYFINERKIYAIFDAPHLIKNIRNNLINNDFICDGKQISFNDIINIYNIDKNNKSKSLKKLTPVHIRPNNFQKMKVKLATQVLSNSVAAAIKTAIDSGELKSSTAQHTADFVNLCNDIFDCLNSKNKIDKNPFRCAITKNSNTVVNKMLLKGKEYFKELKKKTYNKNNTLQLTRPPCFDGMLHTINAIIQLSKEEFTEGTGVKFINTYRLNQDVIENLFGIYRIKGGCNKNPTSKSLRSMFRSNLLNSLMKFDNTNCEFDQGMFVTTQQNKQQTDAKPSTSIQQIITDHEHPTTELPRLSLNFAATSVEVVNNSPDEEVTLEKCSVVYFAGWLGKTCIERFDCSGCKKVLLKDKVDLTDKKQLLLINKTYSNILIPTLKSPSDDLFHLVGKVLNCFNNNIQKLYKPYLIAYLMHEVKNEIKVSDDYHDQSHFDYLIQKLLEVKIHDYCKSRKKTLQTASKLKILQNK